MKIFPRGSRTHVCAPMAGKPNLAFSLIEVTIALGLVSFVLVAILGLFSVGLKGVRESETKVNAANLVEQIVERRFALPTTDLGNTFPVPIIDDSLLKNTPGTPVEVLLRADGTKAPSAQEADFKLSYLLWQPELPITTGANQQIRMHAVISWPAQAAAPVNFAEFFTSTLIAPAP